MNSSKYHQACEAIKKAKNVLLVTHDRPDGDALASLCALIEYVSGLGKPFTAFCADHPPAQFSFLPHTEKIRSDKPSLAFEKYDLVIVLDCGGLNRTGLAAEIRDKHAGQTVIEFDHHPKIDSYAEIEIKEPGLSSTAEVLYHFCRINRIKINKTLANCLLTGILTDTANFFHDSTSDATIKIASEMLSSGARFPAILQNTWRNKSLAAVKLWGEAINNLRINHAYRLAVSILPYEKNKNNQISEDEMIGLPAFLSNLHGVNALLLLREEAPGLIKGNLRTAQDGPDISLLAQLLGGGGHPKASGFVLDFNLEKISGRWLVS